MSPNEQEWLANHMGHSLNMEKEYYRLHESTIEITKVGRLLTKIDSGEAPDCSESLDDNLAKSASPTQQTSRQEPR